MRHVIRILITSPHYWGLTYRERLTLIRRLLATLTSLRLIGDI